jgi:hypothetical protein
MALPSRWASFFARHTERHPKGVVAQLLDDWLKPTAEPAEKPPVAPRGYPPRSHNRDSPGRIAQMLAEKMRRRPN